MFDIFVPADTAETRALIDEVCASSRSEAQACARRLAAIGGFYVLRLRESGETATWAVDTWDAVAAEVAAALRISLAMAGSHLRYARAMRERAPRVAAVFAAGDIDFRMFQTIVYRTDLITDEQVLAVVDGQLAVRAPRWPSMTRGRLNTASISSSPRWTATRYVVSVRPRPTGRCRSGIRTPEWLASTAVSTPPTRTPWISG
ncbi:MAG: hypothetical protein JWR37_3487 [Mycobacterium sp.]|nr:hypothetical protein [Mycobacterium sp.]